MSAIRLVLVDDHDLVRQALAAQLGDQPDFEVVASLDAAAELVETARRARADVAVLDVAMPGGLPFDAARALGNEAVAVLFLSAFPTDRHLASVAAMGAGFVCKDDSFETLAGAIRAAAEGRPTYSASVAARLPRDAARLRSAGAGLTRREEEVLCHIARGLAKRDVANRLEISVRTVETHVRNLMEKVGVNDRVELARYAIREGYVEP